MEPDSPNPHRLLTRAAVALMRHSTIKTVTRCIELPAGHPHELTAQLERSRGGLYPMIRYEDALRWVPPQRGWTKGKLRGTSPRKGKKQPHSAMRLENERKEG